MGVISDSKPSFVNLEIRANSVQIKVFAVKFLRSKTDSVQLVLSPSENSRFFRTTNEISSCLGAT
jgi:hypothetical protein